MAEGIQGKDVYSVCSMCVNWYYQSRYYQTKMAEGIQGKDV